MTEVYRNQDSVTIGHLQSLLEANGISTYLRNDYVASTTMPFPEVTPALCILKNADVERGVTLIREHIKKTDTVTDVELTCESCGEVSPGTFATCWKCEMTLTSDD
jgi:hypothetical protein